MGPLHFFPPLSPAARYQNELAGVDTELLAERFYYQALSVAPQIGKWTLAWASQPSIISQDEDDVEVAGRPTYFPWDFPSLSSFVLHLCYVCSSFVMPSNKMVEGEEKWERFELRRREAEEKERRWLSCP